ncbi:glycosyl hydrolase family protein [Arthrobacter frigidicola]|nr:glycosyl hydrolase family protein [Arthrobacter frigidicola]
MAGGGIGVKFCFGAAAALAVTNIGLFGWSDTKGAAMPADDLLGWKLTHTQDFSVPAAAGQVRSTYGEDVHGYSGLTDSSGNGLYTPEVVLSVSGGSLRYFLHTAAGVPRVASVVPFGYAGQTYGRYSVKFRSDSLPGYKIAFMLWPTSDDWNEGEIDWPEGNLNEHMYAASAIKGSLSTGEMRFDPIRRAYSSSDSSTWHIATTEWTPGKVRWFWDGQLVSETFQAQGVPTTDMRWTLQAETELGGEAMVPHPDTSGYLEVDWVVQYAYAPDG